MRRLASPYLALMFFPVMALCSLGIAHGLASPTVLMVIPFSVLAINLAAAIAVHARFRVDGWLLLFHLALMSLVLLVVIARLTHFEGKTPITRGGLFDGYLEATSAGILHGERYRQLKFSNLGFLQRSADGPYAGSIINRVGWQASSGGLAAWHEAEISDDVPLILDGYRIYPGMGKGLSPMLLWEPAGGESVLGAIQLPPFGSDGFQNGAEWKIDNGPELWAWIGENPGAPTGDRENLGVEKLTHTLVIRSGNLRFELRPGDAAEFPDGRLRYLRLESWLGYLVIYDPTRPWLVANVLVAVISLSAYYLRRLARRVPETSLE